MQESFYLTTEQGRNTALTAFDKYGWAIPYASTVWLARKAATWFNPSNTIEAQKQAALDLIKAGKNNNVESMTITLDQTAGLDFCGGVDGIPIK